MALLVFSRGSEPSKKIVHIKSSSGLISVFSYNAKCTKLQADSAQCLYEKKVVCIILLCDSAINAAYVIVVRIDV